MVKKQNPIKSIKTFVNTRRPSISEVVREPTAGGVVFRRGPKTDKIEILLIQDAKDTSRQCAEREITEETGIAEMQTMGLISKVNFRFRRQQSLVLMTTEIFLIHALGATEAIKPEDWMKGIAWFTAQEALDKIEYEDIGKAILMGLKKIREAKL
jgi:8-oxo-dGTP pyrophosphatase MutT (NUDIX family)